MSETNLHFFSHLRHQLINSCLSSRLSKTKCVTLCATLLMGSQSFSGDPYPYFHPLSRQTAHDCPWLLLWCCCLMPQIPLSATLSWQFSPSCELKPPFANPALTTGASGVQQPPHESTPPGGRLVTGPPLLTGRSGVFVSAFWTF